MLSTEAIDDYSAAPSAGTWTMGQLCAAHAACPPHAVAVSDGDTTLSYPELQRRVEGWAADWTSRGVSREQRVVVFGDKQVHSVVAILSVCRAGATYVPLDRHLPARRLAALIEDAAPACVIAPSDMPELALACPRLALEQFDRDAAPLSAAPASCARPDDVAYIMYTSGSTGRPKGVQIEHRAIQHFFHAHNRGARVDASDRCMNTGPFHFDVSIMDVFLPLYFGASVVLTPELPHASLLLSVLEAERITNFYAVGTILRLMTGDGAALDDYDLRSLETLQTGAEVCDVRVVNHWLRRMPTLRFVNSYGPTELTVGCMQFVKHAQGPLADEDCPIGEPHPGSRVRVVVADGGEVAQPGVVGELLVGGEQLMRGYWRRPEEERRAFVVVEGQPFYRTGDHVFRDTAGQFHYRGRCDDEIKLDGQRIHLSEVRTALLACPDVIASAVGTFEDLDGTLRVGVAAIARSPVDAALTQRIMTTLSACLMAAAVPRALLFCAELPQLSSGKLDVARCMQWLQRSVQPDARAFVLHGECATPVRE